MLQNRISEFYEHFHLGSSYVVRNEILDELPNSLKVRSLFLPL